MTGEGSLLVVAEIGVAFAGFASVVTAFRRRSGDDWSPEDAMRFQFLIIPSLAAMALALLPFVLAYFGVGEPDRWRACSVVMGVIVGVIFALVVRRLLKLIVRRALHPAVAIPSLIGALAVVALQFCNAAGAGLDPGIAAYFAGLFYLLLLSAASFARLLPIGRRMR